MRQDDLVRAPGQLGLLALSILQVHLLGEDRGAVLEAVVARMQVRLTCIFIS